MSKKLIGGQPELEKLLQAEINVMKILNHKNIVGYRDYIQSASNYYLVLEICNQGDLKDYLKKQKSGLLPENEAKLILD